MVQENHSINVCWMNEWMMGWTMLSCFWVSLSLADVFDIPLLFQSVAWLYSVCTLILVHVCGQEGRTWSLLRTWRLYFAHEGDGRVVSFSEVSGSGLHFLVLISDPRYPFLHPSLLFWPLTLHPHIWILDTCWYIVTYDLWVLNSAWILAQYAFLRASRPLFLKPIFLE